MSKLKWLRVEEFRNLVPGTRLEFNEGLNVLLGKNGTGKTNLLHLISMALRLNFSALATEAFHVEFSVQEPAWLLRFEYEQRALPPDSELGSEPESPQLELHLCIEAQSAGGDSVLLRASPAGATVSINGAPPAELRPVQIHLGKLSAVSLWIAGVSKRHVQGRFPRCLEAEESYRFDEQLLAFEAMHGRGEPYLSSPPPSAIEVREWLEGEKKGTTALWSNFVPADLGAGLVEEDGEAAARNLSSWSTEALGLEADPYREFDFGCHGEDGAYMLAERLSFGEKRLLAFSYYLDASPQFAVADELANGLHHDWIRIALDQIGDRQAFLTSQNSLLLDFLPISSAAEATAMFIRCEHAEGRKWRWSNFKPEEGEEFYRELSVGIEHVSQILRTRGLW